MPAPERSVLPNGVGLNVLNACDNDVTRIDVVMAGGYWHQEQPLQALFTNRMLREGTARYTAAGIAEKLDYYGAWLDLSSAPEYSYVSLYTLNKYVPQTLDILESMVKEPLFPDRELKVVVDNNVERFKVNVTKVDFLAHRELVHALFGGQHPVGRLVGEDDYRNVTAGVLRPFYENYYHSGNCTVYLSGKISDDSLRRAERVWGDTSFGSGRQKAVRRIFHPVDDGRKHIFIERPGVLQSAVRMGMLLPDRFHPDFLKLRVLVTLLGGYFGSRLMSNIREDKGYTYGISAGIVSYPGLSLLVINAETAPRYVAPLIAEVYREIERLQNEPVSCEELAMVRNYMLGDMCRSCESAFSLADGWIFLQTSGLPEHYFADAMEAIKTVTPAELRELAQEYLCVPKLKEVVVGAE